LERSIGGALSKKQTAGEKPWHKNAQRRLLDPKSGSGVPVKGGTHK